MKISEVYPEYVFQRLGKNLDVDCVDFGRKQYIDLAGQTVSAVQALLNRANVKFYQFEDDENTES